jgi:hypothetical protein
MVKPRERFSASFSASLWRFTGGMNTNSSDILGDLTLGIIIGFNRCELPSGKSSMEACVLDSTLGMYGWINIKRIVRVE